MKNILFSIGQWVWGILQTILGLFGFVFILIFSDKRKIRYYKGVLITVWAGKRFFSGVSLGFFVLLHEKSMIRQSYDSIFICPEEETINHEYGHCIQSIMLGPLYLFIVGIKSLINYWTCKNTKVYYTLFPEKWADKLGGVNRV